jgi:hypothetical protein
MRLWRSANVEYAWSSQYDSGFIQYAYTYISTKICLYENNYAKIFIFVYIFIQF